MTYDEAKNEVAKNHGLDSFLDANVYNRANELSAEAAELYARKKYETGYKDGWNDGVIYIQQNKSQDNEI